MIESGTMTQTGTIQLSMNIDPELKKRIKLMAIQKDLSITELVSGYILTGLSEDEEKIRQQ